MEGGLIRYRSLDGILVVSMVNSIAYGVVGVIVSENLARISAAIHVVLVGQYRR
jgi:hypothetical protein